MFVAVGFAPDEIRTDEPTRSARLKWVIVVARDLPPGRAANAAACVAAATGPAVGGLLGPNAVDGSGSQHPGLPWAGCTVLVGDQDELRQVRAKAAGSEGMFVADMPVDAQLTRVYDEYLDGMKATDADGIVYAAVGLVGPRNRVDRIVKRLSLLP